jgi:alpha-1,6-mannosyltransferase
MRIVDVNEFYSPTGGGVRTYIDRKIEIMAELGHELIVIACGRRDWVDERPGGGRVIYVKAPPLVVDPNYGLFWNGEPITRLLDELQPDVVEVSSPWRPAWIVANWQGNAKKVFFMHNDNVGAYPQRWLDGIVSGETVEAWFAPYSRYMNRFLARYDAVLSNGPALVKRLGKRGVRVDGAVPLGIERSYFSPDHRDERLRAALLAQCDLPPDGHLLLGLGRHHPEKRWPMVIDAVERVGATRPVGMILVGTGIATKTLEKRIAGSPHIRLFRPVYDRPRLARIIASCDALVHGCETETFGLVASEALASGLPLVVPDAGGCGELAHPLYAETYRARDARSCAAAIERLLSRDQRVLKSASRVAAARVPSDRDHAEALIAYYDRLIAGEPSQAIAA